MTSRDIKESYFNTSIAREEIH